MQKKLAEKKKKSNTFSIEDTTQGPDMNLQNKI